VKKHSDPESGRPYEDVIYQNDKEEFTGDPASMLDAGQAEIRVAVYRFSHFAVIKERCVVVPYKKVKPTGKKAK